MLSRVTLESLKPPMLRFKWDYRLWKPQWKPGVDWVGEIKLRLKQAKLAALLNDDWYAGVTWKFLEKELQYAESGFIAVE